MTTTREREAVRGGLRGWLLGDLRQQDLAGPHAAPTPERQYPWWRVMCLTGVDYFSTLGYQPGIAALAAGAVAPLATLVLVALTLFGALPIYRRVAVESPNGEGSIAMLERLLPRWKGKLFVLVLLGFAATDFVITITLSAADATAHLLENPYAPGLLHGEHVIVTLILIALLGAVFLAGLREAITIAVVVVGIYLTLNVVVVATALQHVISNPQFVAHWSRLLAMQYSSPLMMLAVALLVFPKLALGLSGFETGVAVMPQIRGDPGDTPEHPYGRIRGARRMLTTAALIMSVFLITSSFTTIVLIPEREFEEGGKAYGRALAYLAHEYLGSGFGTVYDISTIVILWFAGASAMAGLLNIVPRYLPRYGMAPNWTRAVRPLVLIFTTVAFAITIIFRASVVAQGSAYATGVLAIMLSAAVAVTLSMRRRRRRGATIGFGVIALVFAYTTVANVVERPDGVKIAFFFITAIIVTSLISRATRSTELRATGIRFDERAERFLRDLAASGEIRLVANEPDNRDRKEYEKKDRETREIHHLSPDEPVAFLEVTVPDASEFASDLRVTGVERHGHRVLQVESSTVPNAIAALLLRIRDMTGKKPHVYFHWAEGNPIMAMIRYLLFGGGDVAPLTREVVREAEPDISRRPQIHVG
ncbi:APC family permease [Actinomadura alba]|uniref:APC family permease n=1 Tax=Actinomadura alba TaxID=406431 RepID=A0ABR7LX92_9ACTN|nr:APC family permease [Actinomadura alba]MBC6469471.1 APC family permease [Actinomadura alba]